MPWNLVNGIPQCVSQELVTCQRPSMKCRIGWLKISKVRWDEDRGPDWTIAYAPKLTAKPYTGYRVREENLPAFVLAAAAWWS